MLTTAPGHDDDDDDGEEFILFTFWKQEVNGPVRYTNLKPQL